MTYQIVDNLREERGMIASPKDCLEAAAIIEELAAVVELLAAMDAPTENGFAFDAWADDRVVFNIGKDRKITVGDLRRAHEALRKLKGE